MFKKVTDKENPLFDEYDYVNSCLSKKKYPTPYQAEYAIRESLERNPSLNLSYYKCEYCGNYHLTSRCK